MRAHSSTLVLLLAVSLLQGCVLFDIHRVSRDASYSSPHIEGSSLVVHSRNGAIEVIADPAVDEVIIEARLTCGGATPEEARERVDEATIVIERDSARTLRIRAVFPGGPRNGDGAKIVVTLPDAEGVEIDTGNGRILARGLSGALVASTSNGSVTVEDHLGEAQIHTSNGKVNVLRHGGPLSVRTSNGRVTVALNDDVNDPFHLRSSNGAISATVGSAFAGRVEFDTSNGSIRINGNEDRITRERIHRGGGYLVVGEEGEADSVIDTSNGSITFHIER